MSIFHIQGIRYLHKRIQSSTPIITLLAAGIVVPMTVEHSNKKQAMHPPTMFCSYLTFVSGLSLRSLVADEFLSATPIWCRYIAIKALVHASALFLASLSFSLSLMMRMNVVDREDGANRAARDAGAVARRKSRVRRACIGSHGGARPRVGAGDNS